MADDDRKIFPYDESTTHSFRESNPPVDAVVTSRIIWISILIGLVGFCMKIVISTSKFSLPSSGRLKTLFSAKNKSNETDYPSSYQQVFPFIFIGPQDKVQSSHRSLYYSLESYREEVSKALRGLSYLLEKALALENSTKLKIPMSARLSSKIRDRIQNVSLCLELDELVMQQLLQSCNVVTSLPDKAYMDYFRRCNSTEANGSRSSQPTKLPSMEYPPATLFQMLIDAKGKSTLKTIDENAYDSSLQIIAHMVRDWTSEGKLIRQSLYGWCCQQLDKYFSNRSRAVLVPGAGLGRLAFDLYEQGYHVEANELSPVMAAAANAILQKNIAGIIHPYTLEPMSNEVDSQRRYDPVHFPDKSARVETKGSLSFTIGDFVGDYYFSQVGTFGAVITCFFIDTASNIYDYIELIRQLLLPGGVWINVGPVQWHGNAMLHASVDELRDLIWFAGFDIKHWKVDHTPIPYREDGRASDIENNLPRLVRRTNYEAYRPLRFIAIRRDETCNIAK